MKGKKKTKRNKEKKKKKKERNGQKIVPSMDRQIDTYIISQTC